MIAIYKKVEYLGYSFTGAARQDNHGELEFLIANNSLLQTPAKPRKDSYITVIAGSA